MKEEKKLREQIKNKIKIIDKDGNEWYSRTQSDGSQVWVSTRNGIIQNGGINNPP